MAQPKEKITVNHVLKLVSQLSTDEQESLRSKLNKKSRSERWQSLCSKVHEQCQNLPQLTNEEIIADIKEIREELKAERAKGGN